MDVAVRPYTVLFLGMRNAARSIMAEAMMNHWGGGKFVGFSAGSHPKGVVHPIALQLLRKMKLPTEGLRSKSWEEFSKPGAVPLDFVFTIYDAAADYSCPYWSGQPSNTVWEIANAGAVEGTEADKWAACRAALTALEDRIKVFVSLPHVALHRLKLQRRRRVYLSPLLPASVSGSGVLVHARPALPRRRTRALDAP